MRILFVIPGDINLPTGGYRYDKRMIEEWNAVGYEVNLQSLEGNYPFPSEAEKRSALETIPAFEPLDIAVVDGLAGGAHPDFLKKLSDKLPVTALVHHPLCLENGLDNETAKQLEVSERQGLKHVKAIATTSPETAKTVKEIFETENKPLLSIPPGVDRATLAAEYKEGPVQLLNVGSIIERKGHRHLIEALAQLQHLDWQLTCIGKTDFDRKLFEEISSLVTETGLSSRVKFLGAVDEKNLDHAYTSAHVFVLPSLYEGYGMVYAEAIVRGLPVIGTTGGAIPDTVPPDCGLLVKPGNAGELKDALEIMIRDHKQRNEYRKNTTKASESFPTWKQTAAEFASFLETQT